MSHQPFEGSNSFLKQNSRLLMRPGRIWIPAAHFTGLDYEITTATDIKSMGTGAANDSALAEINTSGITGITLGANLNSVEHLLAIPADMDLSYPIYFKVLWTANNTSGSVTWDVLYKPYIINSTVIGTAVAATVLSKAIGLDNMAGVAYTVMETDEGRLNGGALPETTEYVQLGVVRTTVATITSAVLLGLNIRYTRKLLQWGSMKHEAKANTYVASEKMVN